MKSINIICCILFLMAGISIQANAQTISYSQPEKEDSRGMSFEIIGKVQGNFLVYKTIRNTHIICSYDNDMKLIQRNNLDFVPDKVLNVDFVSYPDHFFMIYQYQKKNILRCMSVKFDAKGQAQGEPRLLDTTYIGFFADNKIYNTISSEDKQKILVYKIQKKSEKQTYTTLLLNANLDSIKKTRITMDLDDRKNVMSDFLVDNAGNFLFATGAKSGSRDYINKVTLIVKDAMDDNFTFHDIQVSNAFLDELKLKVDNTNKRYLLNSFYYNVKRGDINGIYTALWDRVSNKQIVESKQIFNDTLKHEARTEGSTKMAFNNFFIKDVILKKDGGFILTGEDFFNQSRNTPWNRMDYLYGYPYNSYDYYYNPGFYNPYRYRGYNSNQTRYYYDNIVVMSINKDGKIEWTNVIHKNQFDDETDKFLSFRLFNAGGDLHFIFNEMDRRNRILGDQSIDAGGNITRNPTLKSLDKGYDFMPMYAKQVGLRQIIVPCDYRGYICFAKLEY